MIKINDLNHHDLNWPTLLLTIQYAQSP